MTQGPLGYFLGCIMQCDQIGLFLKSLGDKFSYKRSPINWWFLGLFWKMSRFKKTLLWHFWATFVKKWATLYSNIWSHWLYGVTTQRCVRRLQGFRFSFYDEAGAKIPTDVFRASSRFEPRRSSGRHRHRRRNLVSSETLRPGVWGWRKRPDNGPQIWARTLSSFLRDRHRVQRHHRHLRRGRRQTNPILSRTSLTAAQTDPVSAACRSRDVSRIVSARPANSARKCIGMARRRSRSGTRKRLRRGRPRVWATRSPDTGHECTPGTTCKMSRIDFKHFFSM